MLLATKIAVNFNILAFEKIVFVESGDDTCYFGEYMFCWREGGKVGTKIGLKKELAWALLLDFDVLMLIDGTVSKTHCCYQ